MSSLSKVASKRFPFIYKSYHMVSLKLNILLEDCFSTNAFRLLEIEGPSTY